MGKNQVAYIVAGLETLKATSNRTERVIPPSTYSEFDDYDDIRVQPTTEFSSSRYGAWGISLARLEAAIRFVTGGGRYRASNLKITTLDRDLGWVFTYHAPLNANAVCGFHH